nr:uncharacterized protein LOC109758451 [Aegilops tauschii subsp. strangulata]
MALSACIMCCAKIIVDAGAQEEEQEQCEAHPAAAAQAAVDRTRTVNASRDASNAQAGVVHADADAKRVATEKRAAYNNTLEASKNARSQANQAIEATRATDANLSQAKTNPADDVVAAQNKIVDLEVAAEEATNAAAHAEETAAKADEGLDVISKDLKEADNEVKQKADVTHATKEAVEAAKKTADAAKPKTDQVIEAMVVVDPGFMVDQR